MILELFKESSEVVESGATQRTQPSHYAGKTPMKASPKYER